MAHVRMGIAMSQQPNQQPQGGGQAPQGQYVQPQQPGQYQQPAPQGTPQQGQAHVNGQVPYGQPGQPVYYQQGGPVPPQQPVPKKKKGGCLKALLIGIAVIVVLAILGSVFGGGSSSTSTSSSSSKADSSQESAQKEKDPNSLSVGDTFTDDDGLKVTVNENKTVSSYGSKYVRIKVTYKNTGDSKASYNMLDWQGEDKGGSLENAEFTVFDNALSAGDIKAGGKKTGYIYLPANSKKAVYLQYGSWSDDPQATWKLK